MFLRTQGTTVLTTRAYLWGLGQWVITKDTRSRHAGFPAESPLRSLASPLVRTIHPLTRLYPHFPVPHEQLIRFFPQERRQPCSVYLALTPLTPFTPLTPLTSSLLSFLYECWGTPDGLGTPPSHSRGAHVHPIRTSELRDM